VNVRITRFDTNVKNASSTSTLQSQKFLLEQTFNNAFDNVYRILIDKDIAWGTVDPTLAARVAANTATNTERNTYNNQVANVPRFIEQANLWLAMESEFARNFPKAVAAWTREGGINPSTSSFDTAFSYPENAVLTEDTSARGYEFEFTANPTRNWRVYASASRTESIRSNLPGAEFGALMDFMWEKLNGPMGQLPYNINSNGTLGISSLQRFSGFYDTYSLALQNNGQTVQELSKWRYTAITNYTFDRGRLKNLSLGVNYRYEGPKAIGYGLKTLANGQVAADINARHYNEAVHTWGLSARYRFRLSDRVNWSIQANIINAFQGNKVVPTRTQPDGSMASGMIREGASWTCSNTLSF